MREIEFRGYNGLEWLYTEMIRYVSEDDFWQMMNHETGEWDCVSFIGQYTGLKDKNRVKIYTGDILKGTISNDMYKVVFYQGCFMIINITHYTSNLDLLSNNLDYLEVIGNIYEHSESLEV